MKVVLPLNGGINKDANPLYINAEKGEVIHRKNCRVTSTSGGRDGINTSIKGMTYITPAYPSTGVSKVIGFVEDKERDQAFYFLYNSLGNSMILKLKGTTVTDLNFDQWVLDFQANEIIDADILGNYCVFTSDYNPPRKFDVTVTDFADVDSYDIQLAVRPPKDKPSIQIASDSSRKVNKLIGKTFQFATMYVYEDYTYSVLSPYSELAVSGSVFSAENNTYDNNNVGNYVQVSYDLGTDNVKTVKLLAREGNIGSWFVVEEYDKPDGVEEYSIRTYPFYNDVARKALVETEALALYSDVPRTARTVLAVQNRIGLGRVKKGYDKINNRGETPDIKYSVEYEDVVVVSETAAMDNNSGIVDDSGAGTDVDSQFYVEFGLEESSTPIAIAEGDTVSVSITGSYYQERSSGYLFDFDFAYSFTHVVTAEDMGYANPRLRVMNIAASDISSKGAYSIVTQDRSHDSFNNPLTPGIDYNVTGNTGVVTPEFVAILFTDVWNGLGRLSGGAYNGGYDGSYSGSLSVDTQPTGVSTFKGGSYYNVGILFYDEFSRTSGVLNPQSVYIPHAGERAYADAFKRARIKFTIPEPAWGVTDWAKYYRFAVTESVNFAGVYPFVTGNGADNIQLIYLDGKQVLAINMPTNLQYEFEKGDYLQLEVDSGAAITNTIVKTIIGTRTEILVGADYIAGFWLIVPKGDEEITDYDEKTAYIYRTKNQVQDLVYFEDSNTYTITYGSMDTATGYVGGEDAWYVSRKFEWSGGTTSLTPIVEDFYLNVDDAIRAYSKGRAVVEFDTLGEITLQDFVWSFNYLDNTKINGISTFNSLNRKQLDEKDGQIQRIRLVGDVIKVVQDNKETSMYVGKAQISDAAGNLQLVKSNDFIGSVNASTDDYGTRYPLSIVVDGRNMYYWDGDQGVVVMSSPNGQHPVSDYGMRSEFQRLKDLDASRVLSYYDKKNGEYVITFDKTGFSESWAFNDKANSWVAQLELTNGGGQVAEFFGRIGTQLYSFLTTKVWLHETDTVHNVFYGDLKTLSVRGVVNTYPREQKCLRAVEMSSTQGLDTVIETPVTNTNIVGQKSILYAETYRGRTGRFTSSVFKNILGAGGVEDIALLHIGNDIVGEFIEIEFSNRNTSEIQLRMVTLNISINK